MSSSSLTPLTSLRVSQYQIPKFNFYPNTSIQHRPLLIYHECFPNPSPSAIESHLLSRGVVVPQWRYTMYKVSHFHSTTHEVLCIVSGRAKLCFGGEENPGRVEIVAGQGDVFIVPAGVAHRLLEETESSFLMVGSYPVGKDWDMCYGKADEKDKIKKIKDLEWFNTDPIYGSEGPVLHV
ncbi:RmlC-like cupin domain-containing protein [Pisolithus thermaeus]|nr:RmlC-like cupin domain-containing protein [Pisolithus croceorrhizus]KAI6163598.1 RmlC-like cupin domain-containing protein [Pisolithus thermaeus]